MKNLEDKVIEILQIHNNEKLTVNDIALKIFKTYPDMADLYNLQVADHKNKKTGLMQCSAEIGARYNSSKSFVSSVAREKKH